MTSRHLEILQHALGVDKFGRTPKGFAPYTRNYFCSGAADETDCRELVEMGYMIEHNRTEMYPYFNCSVTALGVTAMKESCPPIPKLSRSQLRYRRFLDADCDMSFRDWIRYEQNSRFRMEFK